MKKKVAVLVSGIYGSMNSDIQVGLSETALKLGIKLIFFVSFSDGFSREFYDKYVKYDEGDIVSFKLPDFNDFDGIVLMADSFSPDYKERVEKLLENVSIPVMCLGEGKKEYYSLENNDDKSFCNVVEHIVTEHGCKDIYHVAGSKDYDFTFDRINAYKSVLKEHGLPCEDDRVFFGTLWRDCGEPALEYILQKCAEKGKKYPDGIVCANDYTAIGIIDACRKRGIRVPADIIVTGYDGIEVANMGRPSITTCSQPFYEMAEICLVTLQKIWNGEKVDGKFQATGKIIKNQSCGCVPMDVDNTDEVRQVYGKRMGKMEYLAQSTTNMILSLSNSSSMDECFNEIQKNAMVDTGFKNFVLCLAPGWDKQRVIDDSYNMDDEEMTVVAGFIGDKAVERGSFRRKQILPDALLDDPNPYYIFSVHHLQYYMGYIIVTPELKDFNQLIMKSWLVNLGAMLENLRIRRQLHITVERLENLYNRDMLTGLYNRRGYEFFFPDYYEKCLKNNTNLAVLLIDMDDLKMVNDSYGHPEGDYSLCTIAEAMTRASRYGEICLRTGGDEFVVLAMDYSQEKIENYIKVLREGIEERRNRDMKKYPISVSVGSCILVPSDKDRRNIQEISEEYIRLADAEMYKEKKLHKNEKSADKYRFSEEV